MVDQVLPNLTAKRKSHDHDTTPLPASHLASPTPRYQQEAEFSINYLLHVSENAIYYILSIGGKANDEENERVEAQRMPFLPL